MDKPRPVSTLKPTPKPVPPEKLPPQERRPRLAVFGGSFNPVHLGHLHLAGAILRRGLAEEVLFIPAGVPPHKDPRGLAPGADRLAMLNTALAPWPGLAVSDIELQHPEKPSYTYETLQVLTRAFPEHDMLFMMGLDCLQELHTWHRASELVSQFNFLIVPRPGVAAPNFVALVEPFGQRNAHKLLNAVVDVPVLPIAASEIRQFNAQGKPLAGLVSNEVAAYIREHRLYLETPSTTEGTTHG